MIAHNNQQTEIECLLHAAKEHLPHLKELLLEISGHWGYEDPIYRFYHQSFKVYSLQGKTQEIVTALQALAPHLKMNKDFKQIITKGIDQTFHESHNREWLRHTRPIVEAFFHAKYMLEMICKYAEELEAPPQLLPSGWATVLYLYNLR